MEGGFLLPQQLQGFVQHQGELHTTTCAASKALGSIQTRISQKSELLLLLLIVQIMVTSVSQHKSEIFLRKTPRTPPLFPLLLLPHFIPFIKSVEGVISAGIIFF